MLPEIFPTLISSLGKQCAGNNRENRPALDVHQKTALFWCAVGVQDRLMYFIITVGAFSPRDSKRIITYIYSCIYC